MLSLIKRDEFRVFSSLSKDVQIKPLEIGYLDIFHEIGDKGKLVNALIRK